MEKSDKTALPATGERLLTECFDESTVEHLHRYAIALAFCENKDVLDIASGEGYGSHLLAQKAKRVVGVDISNEAVEHARAKYTTPNLQYVQGSASDIPLQSASVDVLVSFETLEHHDKHEEMFFDIKRVLRPNGLLIMSTPDKLYYSDLPNFKNEFHIKEIYLEQFRAITGRHFNNVGILFQRMFYGTFIVPETGEQGFTYYRGDHSRIESTHSIYQPIYNICVASDGKLPLMEVSCFDGSRALEYYNNNKIHNLEARVRRQKEQIDNLCNSTSYRVGRAVTWPIRKLLRR